jgi:tetratricopeptide (TPR) repeat protein
MTRRAVAALLALSIAGHAAAQSAAEAFLSVCGNPKVSAQEAVRTCSRALATGDLTREQEAAAALNLGAAWVSLDSPAQAIAAYDRALAARPGWAIALAGRAAARVATGDLPGAAADWNAAVRAAPDDATVLGGRGAFRLTAGDAEGALADFDRARSRAPRDRDIAFNRALALGELGRDAEAEAGFTAILAAHPDDHGARLNRARLRAGSDPQAALADYAAIVAAAPGWSQPLVEQGALLDALGRRGEADASFRRAWELGHRSEALTARIQAMGAGAP